MTMTDVRAAALGEFPPPPPCPLWCETDHANDFRSLVSWSRYHHVTRGIDVPGACVTVWVTAVDRFWGGEWEPRDRTELAVGTGVGQYVRARQPDDVSALVALAGLISPEVGEAVQAAALLLKERSPEVTPAGEDQRAADGRINPEGRDQ